MSFHCLFSFPKSPCFQAYLIFYDSLQSSPSCVLENVYIRSVLVSAVMRPKKLSITNEYAASSEKSVPDRRISMKLYTFAIIESKKLSR